MKVSYSQKKTYETWSVDILAVGSSDSAHAEILMVDKTQWHSIPDHPTPGAKEHNLIVTTDSTVVITRIENVFH